MLVSFSKNLQGSKLQEEYKEIERNCILNSFSKEHKVNNYIKKINVLNRNTGIVSNVGDYQSQISKRSHNNLQKSSTIVNTSIQKGLIPIFITLTLPSRFHPFTSKEVKKRVVFFKNKNFDFKNISTSIKEGYQLLSQTHRSFYKRLKNVDKELTFINCVEYHKSFIPHMHLLLFVRPELVDSVKQRFLSTIQKFQLTRTDFQVIDNDFNIEIVSSYIRKYMFKSLTLKDDTQDVKTNKLTENRKFDGYLKLFKIRQFRMNQLKLSLEIYNKVYYSLNKEFKTKIIEKITPLKKSLFQFIMENIKITKRVISVSSLTLQQSQFSLNNTPKIFEVIVNSIKNTNISKVVNLLIYQTIDDEKRLIYNKQDFQVLTT